MSDLPELTLNNEKVPLLILPKHDVFGKEKPEPRNYNVTTQLRHDKDNYQNNVTSTLTGISEKSKEKKPCLSQSKDFEKEFCELNIEKHECRCYVNGCENKLYNCHIIESSQESHNSSTFKYLNGVTNKKDINECQKISSTSDSKNEILPKNGPEDHPSAIVQQVKIQYSGFRDIAGLEEVKQSLRQAIIYPMKYPHLFINGRSVWSRALLFGPPGVGKTALAQAVAAEAGIPLYQVSSADLTSVWTGQSEKLIRRVFETLAEQRCVLLLDEVDSLCRKRAAEDTAHCRKSSTELLIQMQLYEGSAMFLLCATNCPWEIDPAFLRRFQQRIYVPLPDFDARDKIVRDSMGENCITYEDSNWKKFITATDGLSGSDLKNIARRALMVPLQEMQTAKYWVETEMGRMVPARNLNKNAIFCNIEDIPDWKVWCRPIEMNDLWTALQKADRTITQECVDPFQVYINQHKIK